MAFVLDFGCKFGKFPVSARVFSFGVWKHLISVVSVVSGESVRLV